MSTEKPKPQPAHGIRVGSGKLWHRTVSFRESAFFASGNDAVEPASLPIIAKVADEIRKLSNPLRIEGHTDSVPSTTGAFAATGNSPPPAPSR
jgi:outer membrane protein OmpA-like peptidoglycan-associated protein